MIGMYEQLFNELVKRSKAALPPAETDAVGDDGLRFCTICGKKRETFVRPSWAPEALKVPIRCDCDREEDQAFAKKQRQEERKRAVSSMKSISFDDPKMKAASFAGKGTEMNKAVNTTFRFLENFDKLAAMGQGLLLYGPTGVGKTFAVACLVNALNDQGVPAVLTSFPAIADWMTEDLDHRNAKIRQLQDAELLAIDDLGAERSSEYMQETVERIIDARYRSKKPLIITTNLRPEEMKAPNNVQRSRIYSRIKEMCVPVAITGEDRRSSGSPARDSARLLLGV